MSQVFIDTHALIAIASTRDMDRARVLRVLAELESRHARFVTTDAILTEFCNAMARSTLRRRGAQMVRLLQARDDIEIVHVTRELFERALILFEGRPDKDWGLTDCISFEVMKERRIARALTADHHFAQAGFKPLI